MRRLAAVSFLGLAPRSASAFAFPRLCSPVAAGGPWLQRAHAHPLCSAAWSSMTVVELKAALKERSLKVSGKKADLIERLEGGSGSGTAPATVSAALAAARPTAEARPAAAALGRAEEEAPRPGHDAAGQGADAAAIVDASALSAEAKEAIITRCANQLGLGRERVAGAIALFDEGNTMPFVARYRKEATGGMDETELRALETALSAAQRLEARRATVLAAVDKLGKLTPELQKKIMAAELSANQLEDLYLPFKAKRRTKASIAREAGLQPLADAIMRRAAAAKDCAVGDLYTRNVKEVCLEFERLRNAGAESQLLEGDRAVEALRGACEIVAEEATEDAAVRAMARGRLRRGAVLTSKEKKAGSDAEGKYKLYHTFRTQLGRAQPHQVLAINRGEALKVLSASVEIDEDVRAAFEASARGHFTRTPTPPGEHASWRGALDDAIADGTKRLLVPSLEREWRRELTEAAEDKSFLVYSTNLRQKLLQPPLKGHVVAAIDPGLRTGCKVAVVSATGNVLATDTLMLPLGGRGGDSKGGMYVQVRSKLVAMLSQWAVSLVAIGNGTGNREAEALVTDALTSQDTSTPPPKYLIIDESGASVYSASELAVSELPSMDVSIRGAVSLARRVQDPLSELVKVDPKALGVGMYQHDVDQKRLAGALDKVVESAVNAVGVDLNVASPTLLSRVAGLSLKTAQAIVAARDAANSGRLERVDALTKVKGVGPKAYEQCAGFLRVYGGTEPLDATAIHPESYGALRVAAERIGEAVALEPSQLSSLAADLGVGVPTLSDALEALRRSGSDPRDDLLGVPPPRLIDAADSAVGRVQGGNLVDLAVGDELLGVVKNVVDFGAFVDIGMGTDALLHSSEMRRGQGRSAAVIQVGAQLRVVVRQVEIQDLKRKKARISLALCGESA